MKSFLTFPLFSVALQLIGASACMYSNVKEMCDAKSSFYPYYEGLFYQFCQALNYTNYLSDTKNSLLDSNQNFTIFAATDEGWGNYYLKVLESTVVGSTALEETLEYGIIAGAQLETIDLMVNKKIDIISTKPGAKPKIISKTDVLLEEYAYIKGKANTGDYIPKFITPDDANPDLVCNANIFSMSDVILVNIPNLNL
mmetsp:Transcript_15630/g.33794  ORF Transcript_15630/g.33794 Transcript_15630/m.33794 type:complete len:198 (+) Transcript_15630:187-780(+)